MYFIILNYDNVVVGIMFFIRMFLCLSVGVIDNPRSSSWILMKLGT